MRRLINLNLLVALGISAVLVAGAGITYRQILKDRESTAAAVQVVEAIRESENISAEWGTEVGRVKNRPYADFDSLKDFIPKITAQRDTIITSRDRMGELPNDIRNEIRAYLSRLRTKQEVVERFKTDFAVVRNSQDFLLNDPEGVKALLDSAREGGRVTVEDAARVMLDEMGQFLRTPNQAWRRRTRRSLETLVEVSDGTPEMVKVEELARHVEVLLDRYEDAEERFEEAISNREISSVATSLTARLEGRQQEGRIYADYLNYALYIIAGCAILYWASLGMRLFRGHRREAEVPAEAAAPASAGGMEQGTPQDRVRRGAGRPRQAQGGTTAEADAGWTGHRVEFREDAEREDILVLELIEDTDAEAIDPVRRPEAGAPAERERTPAAIPAGACTRRGGSDGGVRSSGPRTDARGRSPSVRLGEGPAGGGPALAESGDRMDRVKLPPPPAEADIGIEAAAAVGPAPEPLVSSTPYVPAREGRSDLTAYTMVKAIAGKLAEVAGELDQAAEAGETLRLPGAECPEQALGALLGRLAGARWNAHRLAAQAQRMFKEEIDPCCQRTDLRDALTWLLDMLDETQRKQITAVLLPGAVADIDRHAFEAAMDRILSHALEAVTRHPGGAGHVELTLTTHEDRHCISCIDHGPGPPLVTTAAARDAPHRRDTLDLDIARRLITAQGGEFEATTYPPYGSRIRVRLHPATETLPRGRR